jgi:hypothetical protein
MLFTSEKLSRSSWLACLVPRGTKIELAR